MKLFVIGCGQCGGKIADQFALMNSVAERQRQIRIATNVIAVNSDVADLSGLVHIKRDYQHRILIGAQKTGGHGVGKLNEIGAEIARDDADKIIEAIRSSEHFAGTDAFMLIASAAGGTGSGSVAVLTQYIKERFPDKPVYNIIALPFAYEEVTEERSVYNVGTCLKSAYLAADAVFLVDNQRYMEDGISIKDNLHKINYAIVKPFFNLLCAGEETNARYVGSRVLDGGDIIQTLSGWSVIGYGNSGTAGKKTTSHNKNDFTNRSTTNSKGLSAMEEALNKLSLKCEPTDARKAVHLISCPPTEMGMETIKGLSAQLKTMATNAIIRSGDYPRSQRNEVEVTVILSELVNSKKVMSYFNKALDFMAENQKRQTTFDDQERIERSFSDLPSLF
ncbi:MAG: tubulin/FtsZ family protein [Chloroflexi bacterium]|nr:tubulin/FtsZ family protein [Chloroflexota bacterium]